MPTKSIGQLHRRFVQKDSHDPPFKNQTALEAAKTDFDYLSGLLAS
jgi:hypothetical protein